MQQLDDLLVNPDTIYQSFFEHRKTNNINVLDLFSGCGGMSLGFKNAGFNILAGVDNDKHSLETYSANIDSPCINIDLSNPDWINNLSDLINMDKVDIIIGGPPCQGYSLTGIRDEKDPRNILYDAMFKAIDNFKPKIVVIENVKGMATLFKGKAHKDVKSRFQKRGFHCDSKVLNAAEYGVPQIRERLFFLATSNSNKPLYLPGPMLDKSRFISCEKAISDLPSLEDNIGIEISKYNSQPSSSFQSYIRNGSTILYNHVATAHKQFVKDIIKLVPDGGNHKDLPKGIGKSRTFNEAWTRYASDRPSRTIDTGHRNHFHYKWDRVPTIRENARLQSFPDDFQFYGPKTQQNRQVGNAVPVLLAQTIAMKIANYLQS